MRAYRGFPVGDGFDEWLKAINRNRERITGIVARDISCYEARNNIERSRRLSHLHALQIDHLKEALIHLIICDNQHCKKSLLDLVNS